MPFPPTRATSAEPIELGPLLLDLAEAAAAHRFRVAPNPCVGAAVLSDGVEIGRGFHLAWGGPHAETAALAAAADSGIPRERWDTLVVTLEPCSTGGKQPPCVEAILAAGIRRVVVGAVDPNPDHRGQGLEQLRAAGVEVVEQLDVAPLGQHSAHFLSWVAPERLHRPRPWVIAKWAQTRSGQLSPPRDHLDGRRISADESIDEVQQLRGRVDAILTGVGTIIADDPRLTVRAPGDTSQRPLRVVLDTELRTAPDARVLAPCDGTAGGGEVVLLCRPGAAPAKHRALVAAGARVETLPHAGGRVSLSAAADWLWQAGVRRVLLEAGPTLLSSAFEAGFVDQVAVFTGDVAGGRGPTMAEPLGATPLIAVDHRELGSDALLEGFVKRA
jgi:diaminohydroxyphosphoribosylaminopyrimidine deaminase/5-amino-6-(5-phosphoribosylamino)uracil reductase